MSINFTINGDVLTVFDKEFVPTSIDSSHPNYAVVLESISRGEVLSIILEAMQPIAKVRSAVAGTSIVVTDSEVLYNGTPLHGLLIDRILGGDEVRHLIAFLDKLVKNPSFRAVNELYGFLEKNNHAILEDGNFVAYKIVRSDYRDLYSKTFDNSPGQVVTVPRNMVDEDANRTCSRGLHVCGFEYLFHYGAVRNGTDRVVAVSINPADVVAVPVDYNNAKMRVCEYSVLMDITDRLRDNLWVGVLGYDEWDGIGDRGEYDDEVGEDEWITEAGYTPVTFSLYGSYPIGISAIDRVEVLYSCGYTLEGYAHEFDWEDNDIAGYTYIPN